MATQKRRVIYMSDADWERAQLEARSAQRSISEHIRIALRVPRNLPGEGVLLLPSEDPPIPTALLDLKRTADTRPNPYTAFRPVPKPGRK